MTTPTEKYVLFYNGPGSNWYPAPFNAYGIRFANSEQAFMWHKAHTFGDTRAAEAVLQYGSNPDHAKQVGKAVANFDDSIWSAIRYQLMLQVNLFKFQQNPELCEKFLFAYGTKHFCEASPYDTIWGIGLAETDPKAHDKVLWEGQNLLGLVLDEVRMLLS